ncbi:MAG: SDR family NAD(P)-dependent oxidoreductase, partial [Achromobacter sp.]
MDFSGFPGLAGKTAIVTGSTQGLGADIARGLALAGVNVVLVGRNVQAGEALAQELDGRALFCATDIGQDSQIQRAIDAALARFGRLDILVNNACQYADRGLASSREEWHSTLDTNLVSAAIFT